MERVYSICSGCEYFWANSDDEFEGPCRAFPDGIPYNEIGSKYSHDKVIEGQVGDYVYTRATKKVRWDGREIKIYQ